MISSWSVSSTHACIRSRVTCASDNSRSITDCMASANPPVNSSGSPRRWHLRCRRIIARITFVKHWSISAMPSRSVSAAYLAQAAELAGNPGCDTCRTTWSLNILSQDSGQLQYKRLCLTTPWSGEHHAVSLGVIRG
jgi:hypothetical protein